MDQPTATGIGLFVTFNTYMIPVYISKTGPTFKIGLTSQQTCADIQVTTQPILTPKLNLTLIQNLYIFQGNDMFLLQLID
jgi:hypothetical protein